MRKCFFTWHDAELILWIKKKIAGQKNSAYNASFKLKVINFAEQLNNSAAAQHFTFYIKQVSESNLKKKFKVSNIPKVMNSARGHKDIAF